MPSRLLNRLTHLVVAVEVKHIGDQVQCILVVLDLGVETCQVEPVGEVVFVDFAKVLVATG